MGNELFMLAGTGLQATGTMLNANSQARAMQAQGEYAQRMSNVNANFTDIQAQDAIRRGDKSAQRLGLQTRQLIGAQRAAAAGGGVEVNSGSPLQLQADAAALSAMDQATIRNNAWKEAMGLKMESSIQRSHGDMAARTGRFNARQTMLGGELQALGQVGRGAYDYYRYTPPMQVPSVDPEYTRIRDTPYINPY